MNARDERKLTTILAADVAGYGRLMSEDESGTLALLKASRRLFAEETASHRGRIVNTAGDGLLAEFASVVEAVDCAVQVQRKLAERNAPLPEARRMLFRIGINLGDVLVDGSDLLGDGINVAARLQALADPGGILISGAVFDQVKDKLALGFEFLGRQAVKNISNEVPTYRIVLAAKTSPSPEAMEASVKAGRRAARIPLSRGAAYSMAVIGLLFAIDLLDQSGTWWFQWPALGIGFIYVMRAVRRYTAHGNARGRGD